MSKADKFVQDHIDGKPKKKKKNNDVAPDLAKVGYKRLKVSRVRPRKLIRGTKKDQLKFVTKLPITHHDKGAKPNTAADGVDHIMVTGKINGAKLLLEHLDGPASAIAPGRFEKTDGQGVVQVMSETGSTHYMATSQLSESGGAGAGRAGWALYWACRENLGERAVKDLLEKGEDPSLPYLGQTPKLLALSNGNTNIIRLTWGICVSI